MGGPPGSVRYEPLNHGEKPMEQKEETPIQLDLSVETLALLGSSKPVGPLGTDESRPIRTCTGSQCSPPTCCP